MNERRNIMVYIQRYGLAFALLFSLLLLGTKSFGQLTAVTTADTSLCVSAPVQLSVVPSGGTAYTYSWTPAAGLSNTTIANPIATPTVTTAYQVTITDVPTSSSATYTINIGIQNRPPALAVFPQFDTICQGDTINMNVFNAPLCQAINAGTCQTAGMVQTIGSSTAFGFTAAHNPFFKVSNFFQQFRSNKHQYIFKKAELNAAGISGPTTINAIAWDMTVGFGNMTYNNLTFKMGCITDTILTSTFKTGLSTVVNAHTRTFANGASFRQFNFDQSYVWDGSSNIVMEVCFANATASNNAPFIRVEALNNGVSTFLVANSNICGSTSGTTNDRRPNTRFHFCEVVHDNTLTYAWSPAAGLSSTSVKNPSANPNATTSYILTATDNLGCTMIDTSIITVAPNYTLSVNTDTSLCSSDTITLLANHGAGAGATFKWNASSWINNDTQNPALAAITASDQINITVKSLAGCEKTDSFLVNVVPPVQADILTADTSICFGDSLFIESSTNAFSCNTYSNIACQNPSFYTVSTTSFFPSGGITISPFDANGFSSNPGQKKQFLFLASEFSSMVSTNSISKLGFNIQSITSTVSARDNFTIKMSCTNTQAFSTGSANFETGLQTVFTPKTINVGTGWNDFVFDNVFVWDGISNVVVEICWQNSSSLGGGFSSLNWMQTSFISVMLNWNSTSFCSATASGFGTTFRPEMRFEHCSSPPNPAFDYQWLPTAGLSSDTVPSPMASPAITGRYLLTVTDPATGCFDEDSILINVAPDFNTSVTSDTTLCAMDTIQLGVTHNSALPVTFSWSPPLDVSNPSISNPTTYVNGIGEYISEVRSSQGCIKWDTIRAGLYDQVDLSIVAPTGSYCEGDSVQLDAQSALGCGVSNSVLCASNSTLVLGNSTSTSSLFNTTPFVASDLSAKKQYLIRRSELVTAGISASTQLTSISFNISALGKSDYQDFTIKMGCTSLSAFGTNFSSGMSTVFDTKDVTLTAGVNWFDFDQRFNWDGLTNIIVEICYENDNTGSNSEIFYTQPTPIFNCTEHERGNSVCNDGTGSGYNRRPNIQFKYCSVTPASYNYLWSPSAWFNDPGLQNPKAEINDPGWYKVELIDPLSNCITEDSIQLNVLTFEVEALEDTSLCNSLNYQLDVITNAVQPTYLWTPGNQLNNDTIKNPKVTVPNAVNFIVEVTDSMGCSKKDTVDIIQLPKPTANITPASVDACRFEDIQLNGSGGGTYLWSPSEGLSSTGTPSTIANISAGQKFYLKVTNTFGCSHKDSVAINIYPSPILDLGSDTSYCNGGWITLNAGGEFLSYTWQDNSSDSILRVDQDGNYWVRVTDAYACVFTDTVNIEVSPAPVTDITYLTNICQGDSAILDALNSGSTYKWSTGERTQSIVVRDSGFYWVEIDNGRCVGLDSTIVSIYQYPVSYMAEEEYYCEKENPFGMTLFAGSDEYTYLWDNGNVTNSIVVTEEGSYSVVITNGDECSIERVVDVKQLCSELIFVPNSFTPNNDWKNDKFTITALNLDEFEFRIFNRWGEQIYYTVNPEFEWNGEYEGKPLPDGVYVWRLDYKIKQKDGSLDTKYKAGSITILR